MKPILFNTEMIKAILDSRKVQSRRIFSIKKYSFDKDKKSPKQYINYIEDMRESDVGVKDIFLNIWEEDEKDYITYSSESFIEKYSKYQKDDVIWVREPTEYTFYDKEEGTISFRYKADFDNRTINFPNRLKDKIYINKINDVDYLGCPNISIKEMARIFLKITDVRVERLQDIRDEDCLKEGIRKQTKDGEVFKYCVYDNKDYSSVPWQDMPRSPKEVWINLWNKTSPKGCKYIDNPYVFVYEFERVEK